MKKKYHPAKVQVLQLSAKDEMIRTSGVGTADSGNRTPFVPINSDGGVWNL